MDMSAWGVLGASVVINVLVKGTLKSIGVLMLELEDRGISTTEAAWIPAIGYTLFACLSSPVARLVELTSSRLVAILGGLLLSLGVLLASMPSLPQLYLGLGVALGAGGCMATLPGVLEINKRFQDTGSRGLVHGVSLAGNTVGGLLLPGILARLVFSLDYEGALIVHSGLLLHIIPAALLYSKKYYNHSGSSNAVNKTGSANVLKNGRLWCCIFGTASTAVGYTNFGLYLPLHLHTVHGLSSTEAASFISVFSAGDLIGRILGPALSDILATTRTLSADTPIKLVNKSTKSSEDTCNQSSTSTSIQSSADTPIQSSVELTMKSLAKTSIQSSTDIATESSSKTLIQTSASTPIQSSTETPIQCSADVTIQLSVDTPKSPFQSLIKTPIPSSATTPIQSSSRNVLSELKPTTPTLSSATTPTSSSRWVWFCAGLVGSGCSILLIPLLSLPQLALGPFPSPSLCLTLGTVVLMAGMFSGVWCGVYPALLSDELGHDNLHISYPISQTVAGVINLVVPPSLAVLAVVAHTGPVMGILGVTLIVGAWPLAGTSMIRSWRSGRDIVTDQEDLIGDVAEDSKDLIVTGR